MINRYAVAIPFVALTLAGCNLASFETTPVPLETASGTVICQLYARELVIFDRSISQPTTMTQIDADEACREEGDRQLKELNAAKIKNS